MRNIVTPDRGDATPRYDAHHHLFAPGNELSGGAAYSADDYARDVSSVAGVLGTVHVQARNHYDETAPAAFAPVGETRWLAALTRPPHVVTRCVGFVDLTLGVEAGPVLDAHRDAAPELFAGVRHSAAWSEDPARRPWAGSVARPGLLQLTAYSAGVAEVHRRGLVFETWVFADQLDDLTRFARSHPDGAVVVDHLGGPYDTGADRDETLARWRRAIRDLARLDNVRIKLGGIGMPLLTPSGRIAGPVDAEAIARHWGAELDWCVEAFGPRRCLLGTNFPVDRGLCDYATMWAAFDLMIAGYSAAEQDRLRHGTALEVYGR